MRKHRSFHPTALSPLENRVVPSHSGVAPAALVQTLPPVSPPVSSNALALNGTITGTFVTTAGTATNASSGSITTFQGSGTITGLGQVRVSGSLVSVVSTTGQVSSQETFTLSNAQGSVAIQLTKVIPSPSTSGTTVTSFSIIKATGAFQRATDTGTATLQTITEAIPVTPPTVAKGVFTLTLKSNPSPNSVAAALSTGSSAQPALRLAAQATTNKDSEGAATQIPAFFNGQSVTINVLQLSDKAAASILANNPRLQTIFVTNDLDQPQTLRPCSAPSRVKTSMACGTKSTSSSIRESRLTSSPLKPTS